MPSRDRLLLVATVGHTDIAPLARRLGCRDRFRDAKSTQLQHQLRGLHGLRRTLLDGFQCRDRRPVSTPAQWLWELRHTRTQDEVALT